VKLAIVPIAYGTGIKTKILDLLSFGIPVVTNEVGAEGLDVNGEFRVESTFEACGQAVVELVSNSEKLIQLSQSGYEYSKLFNEDKTRTKYLDRIAKVIERRT